MFRFFTIASLCAVLTALAGCGNADAPRQPESVAERSTAARPPELAKPNNTRSVNARDMVKTLVSAGLEVKDMGPASLSLDDSSRFPQEPRSTLLLRVADGRGNASPMTFVEFDSWKTAAEVDAKPINGFAVRNWFVAGTTSKHFVTLVKDALDK